MRPQGVIFYRGPIFGFAEEQKERWLVNNLTAALLNSGE